MISRRCAGLLAALALLVAPTVVASPALAAFGEVNAFGSYGTGQGQFGKFAGFLDVDTQRDQVLVGDFNELLASPARIVPFTGAGLPLATYDLDGAASGLSGTPWSGTAIPDGAVDAANRRLYVIEIGALAVDDPPPAGFEHDFIVQTNLDTHTESYFAQSSIGRALDDAALATGRLEPSAIAVVPAGSPHAGDVYVAGVVGTRGARTTHLAIWRFDSDGRFLNAIGAGDSSDPTRSEPGRFNDTVDGSGIRGVAVDPRDGSVWELDGYDDDPATDPSEDTFGRVQHFRADGGFVEQVVSSEAHPIYAASWPADIAVGPDGSLWLDSYVELAGTQPDSFGVIRFAPQGGGGYAEAQRFGDPGVGTCQFASPPLIAVDGADVWTASATGAPLNSASVKLFGDGGRGCGAGNADPVITPGSVRATPATPLKGQTVSFTAAATDDGPVGDLRWRWDLDGDGTYDTTPSSSAAASTSFARAGPVSVRVRVTDADGAGAERTLDLVVTSQKPTASFTAGTTTPLEGQAVQFDASASSDPDGTVARYEWDTGSGFQAGGATMSASFAAGARTVRLRVTDADGDVSAIARKDLQVTGVTPPPPPTVTTPPPPPPSDTSAPTLALGTARLGGSSSVSLTIGCPGGETSCSGSVTLETASAVAAKRGRRRPKRVLTLGSATFAVVGGKQVEVRVRLSSTARSLLRRGSLKTKLVVRAQDAAGNVSTSTRNLTLKLRPPKKHRR